MPIVDSEVVSICLIGCGRLLRRRSHNNVPFADHYLVGSSPRRCRVRIRAPKPYQRFAQYHIRKTQRLPDAHTISMDRWHIRSWRRRTKRQCTTQWSSCACNDRSASSHNSIKLNTQYFVHQSDFLGCLGDFHTTSRSDSRIGTPKYNSTILCFCSVAGMRRVQEHFVETLVRWLVGVDSLLSS